MGKAMEVTSEAHAKQMDQLIEDLRATQHAQKEAETETYINVEKLLEANNPKQKDWVQSLEDQASVNTGLDHKAQDAVNRHIPEHMRDAYEYWKTHQQYVYQHPWDDGEEWQKEGNGEHYQHEHG